MGNNIWHTDLLTQFNEKLYDGVLGVENIVTDEVSKTFNDVQYYGVVLAKDNVDTKIKDKYFLPIAHISELPIFVTDKTKFSFKGEVFWFVKGLQSVKIPAVKKMTFRELVDSFADYAHSEPAYWKLFKIIMLTAYCDRVNIRVVSEASFGKDGVADVLALVNGGVANLYKATLAKLKYSLRNDLIVVNEIGALNAQETGDLQSYLLQAGAYKPKFENSSRSTAGTKETIELTKKSHVIFHNDPGYYTSKNQKFFEQLFTPAVLDRFPAVMMRGYVAQDFTVVPKIGDLEPEEEDKIKNVISTINYYKENPLAEAKFEIEENLFGFKGKQKQRSLRTFKTLAKYVAEYAEDEEEFRKMVELLRESYEDYKRMVEI